MGEEIGRATTLPMIGTGRIILLRRRSMSEERRAPYMTASEGQRAVRIVATMAKYRIAILTTTKTVEVEDGVGVGVGVGVEMLSRGREDDEAGAAAGAITPASPVGVDLGASIVRLTAVVVGGRNIAANTLATKTAVEAASEGGHGREGTTTAVIIVGAMTHQRRERKIGTATDAIAGVMNPPRKTMKNGIVVAEVTTFIAVDDLGRGS